MLSTGREPRVPSYDGERTIRRARKRFARRQWARRWLAWRRLLAVLIGLASVVGGAWLLFFSSVLAVSDVTIEGTEVLGSTEVRQAAAVPTGEPLATVNLDAIAARVEGLAPVKRVDVSRSWPDKVRIAIEERVAVAVVERDGVVRGLDEVGVLFREYPRVPRDLPVIRMSAKTSGDALAEAAKVVGALPTHLTGRVDHVSVETMDTISLALRDGRVVFWGSADDSALKAKVVDVLLEQKASVYDVSVPGQPTTRQ